MTSTSVDFTRWWAEVCTLRQDAEDRFEAGPTQSAFPRLYGGQLAAQGLLAAAATVPDAREPHSLHTMFLRGGDVHGPVTYHVERTRESRALSTRSVRAEQDGRVLAVLTASFHQPPDPTAASWLRHELPADGGEAAPPGSLPSRSDSLAELFGDQPPAGTGAVFPVDIRYVDRAPWSPPDGTSTPPRNRFWMRAAGELPAVPANHAAALTFATDYPMFEPILFPQEVDWQEVVSGLAVYGASLDHTLWFHRPPAMHDWLFVTQESPIADRSRGFCRAEVRSPDGHLLATVAQEVAFVEPRPGTGR
jgi:acyl-CoA thioesterase-2